ncbi:MAG: hypothetical protein ACKVOG_05000 [Rhodoglobus sp.]
MSNRLWVLGAILVSAAIIVLGWFLGISPKLAEASTSAGERQNVEAQNQAQEAAIALLKQQFAAIDDQKSKLKDLERAIPEAPELDTLIDFIVAASAANGVVVDNVTTLEGALYGGSVDPTAAADPAAVQPAEPGVTDPNAPPAAVDAGVVGRFFTVGISVKVFGSADQVFALVDSLQMGERLFLVTDVDFTTEGESAGTITGFVYVVTPPVVPVQ